MHLGRASSAACRCRTITGRGGGGEGHVGAYQELNIQHGDYMGLRDTMPKVGESNGKDNGQ